jgi:signal transduction histidine kinase
MRVAAGIGLAALCTLILDIRASAQGLPLRTVLIIQEGAENFPGSQLTSAGIREALRSRSDVPIDDFTEYLETDVFPYEEASRALEDYIRRKYRSRRIDLVITPSDRGLRFVLDHRAELFPEAPIVFSAVNVPDDTVRRMGTGLAGIRTGGSYVETLKLALALHPSTEHVFFVENGNQAVIEFVGAQFRDLTSRATLTFINEATVPRLLAAINDVPSRSLIVFRYHGQDTPGQRMYPDDVAALVAGAARVPVYGTSDLYIGSGVVGGLVRDTREWGKRLGALGLRILTGTRAQDIPIEIVPVAPMFDWRAMQRWGISESRLPPGSVIRFRAPSLWREYRREVLAVLSGLLIQSLLIIGLLYQRRARQRAEVESRRNLALAADANRRHTMSALTGSIAHEISQPLNAILHNAQAGEMLVSSNRATPEALRGILSDIRTADVRATQIIERHRSMLKTHQVEQKPVDVRAMVRESLALVSHDTNAKRIELDVELPADACIVVGDQVLLQQVLVNLIMNGIESMADTPPGRRRITVQCQAIEEKAVVSVRDGGTGLPAKVNGQLFEPFVTTKTTGMGIGLTIARSIVDAHRGRLEAHNNPDGGATFTLTLPAARRDQNAQLADRS